VFANIRIAIHFTVDELTVKGDVAYARTHSAGTATVVATGASGPEQNRELFVFARARMGEIARYMFNRHHDRENSRRHHRRQSGSRLGGASAQSPPCGRSRMTSQSRRCPPAGANPLRPPASASASRSRSTTTTTS